jgi:hypothetical protein
VQKPLKEKVAALAREHGIRDRRRIKLDGQELAEPEQLLLAV